MEFGKQIKKAREAAQMTQEQLGAIIGVTGVTIMRYEKNQRQPRFEQLQAIAKALNIDFYDLFDPVISDALKTIVDNNIESVDEAIRKEYGITGDYVVVETDNEAIRKLMQAYTRLNSEGQQIANERVEELTQIPKYQRTEPPEASSGGRQYTDTQKQEKPPESQIKPTDGK